MLSCYENKSSYIRYSSYTSLSRNRGCLFVLYFLKMRWMSFGENVHTNLQLVIQFYPRPFHGLLGIFSINFQTDDPMEALFLELHTPLITVHYKSVSSSIWKKITPALNKIPTNGGILLTNWSKIIFIPYICTFPQDLQEIIKTARILS